MADSASTDSPLEAAAGAASPRAIEAFSLLANETRLSILLALWEAYKPHARDNALPFSELRDRVGMRDSGQFNYHLDKLDGYFIRKTDDGYELHTAGEQLVGTVIAGTGIEDPTFEPTELDEGTDGLSRPTGSYSACSFCGAPTAVSYQDGIIYLSCTECEGSYEESEHKPSRLASVGLDPAGLIDRTPEQAWEASITSLRHWCLSAVEGVCPRCSGPVDTSLYICEEHDTDGPCGTCGSHYAITYRSQCSVCKATSRGPPFWTVAMHPDVIAFFNERGAPLQYANDGVHPPTSNIAEQELVSDEPPRVRVTYEYEGDRLEVLIDEELNVLEVTEPE